MVKAGECPAHRSARQGDWMVKSVEAFRKKAAMAAAPPRAAPPPNEAARENAVHIARLGKEIGWSSR
jgi:hypothetical protein